jgi:phosphate transport system substrate-binding protein
MVSLEAMKKLLLAAALAVLSFAHAAHAADSVAGAGSSAAAPIYHGWARAYQKVSGASFSYEASGSSAGLKKIRAQATGFGASDIAPPESELAAAGLVLFPIAVTGIAPVVHVPKLETLRLTGEVLAQIFLGEITQWDAAPIAQLNPGVRLPALAIKVIVRGDGSGSTSAFADYLARVSPAWKNSRGVKSSFDWPATFTAVKGSEAVARAVKETPGAIGYVDFAYVREYKLAAAHLRNLDGEFVAISSDTIRSALQESEWVSTGTFSGTLIQRPGKFSWPVTMGTFALVPKVTEQPAQTLAALKFFTWAFLNGDALVQESKFVRLPDRVQAAAFRAISSVRDKAGNPIGLGLMR